MPSAFDPDSIWVSGTDVRKAAGDPGSTTPIRDTATGLGKVKAELDELIDNALRNLSEDTTPELGGTLGCLDNVVSRPELQDYAETSTTPSSSAGTLTLDLETGNVFEVTLTEDVTTLNLNNPPASGSAGSIFLIIAQDATGGWSITWPGSVQWPGGTAPTLTGTASSVDIVSLVTRDGGTTWYGFEGGLDFS